MAEIIRLGIDPGIQGAIAILAGGDPVEFLDLPTELHPRKGNRIHGGTLIATLRGIRSRYAGACIEATVEEVFTMGHDQRGNAQRMGDGYGTIRTALTACGIEYNEVRAQEWKKPFGFIRRDKKTPARELKDLPRVVAIDKWPHLADKLKRKKDQGRADALWIAMYSFHMGIRT